MTQRTVMSKDDQCDVVNRACIELMKTNKNLAELLMYVWTDKFEQCENALAESQKLWEALRRIRKITEVVKVQGDVE